MKELILTVLLCVTAIQAASAQSIQWSESQKMAGRLSYIIPLGGSDFFTMSYKGMFGGSTYLNKHSQFLITNSEKIQVKVPTGTGMMETLLMINGELVIFLSDRKDGENTIYLQKFKTNCLTNGAPEKIMSYKIPKGRRGNDYFGVVQSEDLEFYAIYYQIPGKNETKDLYGYKVYDKEDVLVSEGEHELQYDNDLVALTNKYLSNSGDFFVGANVFVPTGNKGLFKEKYALDKVILMHVTPEGVNEVNLEMKVGKTLSDFTFSSDNNRLLTFTGLFGEKDNRYGGISGVFYFQLDFDKGEIIKEGWNKFDKDFITSEWSDRQKKRSARQEVKGKGKGTPTLFSYDVRETHTLNDGSLIGLIEQYYVHVVTTTDPKTGATRTTYYYHYNDIVAYKINTEGVFEWVTKIDKAQVSTNDGGYFSSFASYINDGELNLIFNDNVKNYTETGVFINEPKKFLGTSYRKNRAGAAKVTIDLENGKMEREIMFKRKEVAGFVVPKQFCIDEINQEVLLVIIESRKKIKFGLMKY